MTGLRTAESEIEQAKVAKIRSVASEAATVARRFGHDPGRAEEFLSHYFRHVDTDDIEARVDSDLLGLVADHFKLAQARPAGRPKVRVYCPVVSDHGWSAGGETVAQIITDDHPFLVDSVTMEVLRQGWSMHEVFHPQFAVRRDVAGRMTDVVRTAEREDDPTVLAESWMHLEISPPSDAAEGAAADLEAGLVEVLRSVEESVTDWQKMRETAEATIHQLQPAPQTPAEDVAAVRDLLKWLIDDNFTFLGYREYTVAEDPDDHGSTDGAERRSGYRMSPVTGSGLGILRSDEVARESFDAVPLPGPSVPRLMMITKDDRKSRVHRPSYLDYVGIRTFDDQGRVVGERRFLGLLTSTAYTDSVTRIPVLDRKISEVLRRSGYEPSSHGAKAILDVLNGYPRDELFQVSVSELAPVVERISRLKERRQVRLFARRDDYGRFLSCLVYFPRDRYTTAVRTRMEGELLEAIGAASVEHSARVTESILARLHFVVRMPPGETLGDVDVDDLEHRLTQCTRSWDDDFADAVRVLPHSAVLSRLGRMLPEGYKEDFTANQAMKDLQALTSLSDGSDGRPANEMALAMYQPDTESDQADLRLKIFRFDAVMSLSNVLPHLSLLGVDVVDEHPYELSLPGDRTGYVYEFGFRVPGGAEAVATRWDDAARTLFMDAFRASYTGRSEADPYNALVMGADLGWRDVSLLRAIGRYLRQGGFGYSQSYIASALAANVEISQLLVAMFHAKFDPDVDVDDDQRRASITDQVDRVRTALDEVASLDHDRIIRGYLAVINGCVRTNFYQHDRDTIALKITPRRIPGLPEPRPAFEIYVYSPRVEGVHLRFGSVARGGLRWSDRSEDFRTEILGLVKAQMVKNTVIVPTGAKGGFYCRQLPDPNTDRDAWFAEGKACYRQFIGSLLDVTDNIVAREVVPPERVVRYDADDPYLVVAADKGTATFSDTANELAVDRGFWMGDAFASGGSAGYDHKGMGITARGAWESVKRHFRELGVDVATEDFTAVGIGDMSGDVFGNGMLLSQHIRLLAAFDHRHVFIDPDPDPAVGWAERKRLFDLPRSSWADYNQDLISSGGGVFPRTLKAIRITDPMRQALGLDADVEQLSPAEMIAAILRSPADLLWNGGVGTYVKATRETNAQVGDKSNDQVRINGADLRVRCVGEGGNLGFTQLARIEYAETGGRINADFIDNSAGVDTSDHEVNIKILLAEEITDGRLERADRDRLLEEMTDEVAELVLANNRAQNLALANSSHHTLSMAGVHEDWMERLSEQRILDRALEFLPDTEELDERRAAGHGLTTPELSTLLSYTKIALERDVMDSELPDDPALQPLLVDYFPEQLRERYAERMPEHRLHREIIGTLAVNRFVNLAGITAFHRLSMETGADPAGVLRAQIVARELFRADELEAGITALDHRVEAEVQTELRLEVRTLTERATRWLIMNRRAPINIGATVESFADGVGAVVDALPRVLGGRDADTVVERRERSEAAGVDPELAAAIAGLPSAYAALNIVQIAARSDLDPVQVAEVYFALGQRLGLDQLLSQIIALPRTDRWQTTARAALRDDLHSVHAQLTAEAMALGSPELPAADLVDQWADSVASVAAAADSLNTICDGPPDLARMSVGLRTVRSLLAAEG